MTFLKSTISCSLSQHNGRIFRQKFHFGGGGGGGFWDDGEGSERKGPPAKINMQVDLEDIFRGVERFKATITRRKICPACKGIGAKDARDVSVCPDCRGAGARIYQQHVGMGMYQQFQAPCQRCGARGTIFKTLCLTCSGQKIVVGSDEIEFPIPPGAPDGYHLVVKGMSDESPQHEEAGDLYIVVQAKPHARFFRDGPQLYLTAEPLTLGEALLGFRREFKHLDGKPLILERTEVTQPSFVQVVKGSGMPIYNDPASRGDLLVTYPVALPPLLSKKQYKAFGELLKTTSLDAERDDL